MASSGPWECLLSGWREALSEVVQLSETSREHRAVVGLASILAPLYVLYTSFHRKSGCEWMNPALFYQDVPETKS